MIRPNNFEREAQVEDFPLGMSSSDSGEADKSAWYEQISTPRPGMTRESAQKLQVCFSPGFSAVPGFSTLLPPGFAGLQPYTPEPM